MEEALQFCVSQEEENEAQRKLVRRSRRFPFFSCFSLNVRRNVTPKRQKQKAKRFSQSQSSFPILLSSKQHVNEAFALQI